MIWQEIIDKEREKEYFKKLKTYIDKEYKSSTIYPPNHLIFNAFSKCNYDSLRVVILGQDPYHQAGQAMGLAFSTPSNIQNPRSMMNILKEIQTSVGQSKCVDGDLTPWTKQGVLLLNSVLTVRKTQAGSHANVGWETFTDSIISHISTHKKDIIFLLWGNYAKKKHTYIDENKHHILTAAHPSPFSAHQGFFGCNHFKKVNDILTQLKQPVIAW